MNTQQLRCFVAVAEEVHLGRAAQKLDLLPASSGATSGFSKTISAGP